MTAPAQSAVALLIVAIAAAALLWRAVRRGKGGHCGDGCGAVSPDAKALLKKLRNR